MKVTEIAMGAFVAALGVVLAGLAFRAAQKAGIPGLLDASEGFQGL